MLRYPESTRVSAIFSDCRMYRYSLTCEWGDPNHRVAFIALNPSTADEREPDPAIAREIAFAKHWGFGALDKANIFGWKSTESLGPLDTADPIGPENDAHITGIVASAWRVVLAWGSHNKSRALSRLVATRAAVVRERALHAPCEVGHLGLNQDGQPKHPLYLSPTRTPFQLL